MLNIVYAIFGSYSAFKFDLLRMSFSRSRDIDRPLSGVYLPNGLKKG